MRPHSSALLLCVALFSAALPSAAAPNIAITRDGTLFVDSQEPPPIQKAVSDLAADCAAVFGRPIRLVHSPSEASPTTIWIAFQHDLPQGVQRPSGWEQLHIQALRGGVAGSPVRTGVVLTGSDIRGTIYAIYQFSQQFLGVDPLYWWTDHPPQRRTRVEIPADFSETAGPRVHYRGWFLNDEDLFTGWRPGIRDGTGISLATWDRIFEALLRLKGNMVVPGTWIFPYEPQIQAAVDRGLVITQHHVNVLGLDTYRWPKNEPYSFSARPDLFEAALRHAMSQYPAGAELIASVGYRGQNDYPFWQVDKDSPTTDEGRARVIRSAIDKEIEIAKQQRPNVPIVMNAWREAAQFIHEGYLQVPEGVTLVWPDNGHGLIEDRGKIAAGQGVYYHTAMFDYRSNHWTEMVPLERIQRELGRMVKAGATQFLLVNTANLRPVVMTTRAVMELAWNPDPWLDSGLDSGLNAGSNASTNYLQNWSREEFGAPAADALTQYYKSYFAAPGRLGSAEDATMADNFYQTAARQILLQLLKGDSTISPVLARLVHQNDAKATLTLIRDGCRDADARWQHVAGLAKDAGARVPDARKDFFQANVLTQTDVHLYANRMLQEIAGAALSDAMPERISHVEKAAADAQATEAALTAAEYGKWKGFYRNGDWLLDLSRTRALIQAYLDKLQGRPVPENAIIRAQDNGFAYHMITAYQGTQEVKFK